MEEHKLIISFYISMAYDDHLKLSSKFLLQFLFKLLQVKIFLFFSQYLKGRWYYTENDMCDFLIDTYSMNI